MILTVFLFIRQVATMYHDATIGNAVNIVLVRIIFLEQEEVRSSQLSTISMHVFEPHLINSNSAKHHHYVHLDNC